MTPFDGKTLKKINYNICNKPLDSTMFSDPCWRPISDDAKDFILQCLVRDKGDRPSVEDLFMHPWIAGLPEKEHDLTC